VALIAAGLIIWQFLPQKEIVKSSIAVVSFENQSGDNAYDYLQKAIPNLLITSLEQSKYIRVTTWERMPFCMFSSSDHISPALLSRKG
ncbi:unnamed protein product, partial [marine sediment metagenome]